MDDALKWAEAVIAANPKLAALTVQEMAGDSAGNGWGQCREWPGSCT